MQTLLPFIASTMLMIGVLLIALSTSGILSPSIANTLTSLSTFGQFIIAGLALVAAVSFATLKHLWRLMKQRSIIISSIITTILFIGGLAFIFSWHPAIVEAVPICGGKDGTTWNTPVQMQGTNITCNNFGLVMQQTSSRYYAEEDLEQINGQFADLSSFRMKVQVKFLNPQDTKTQAALIIQTPVTNGVAGGYIFAINSQGVWMLQQVINGEDIPTIQNGVLTDINLSQPITISIVVKDSVLSVYINSSFNDIVHVNDTLPPGLVGLMVERSQASSSKIMYSDFELDSM